MSNTLLADRRDHIIDRLSSGYANGAFEVEELERRVALVHDAQTPAELDALATDLTPLALVPAKQVRIMMGSVERIGPWVVPQHLAARVVCGNLILDLREAQLAHGVTTIEVNITMGNVEVIVPPGVAVEVEASSFLGNVEQRTEPASGTTVVRVVGRVKLGNLELTTRQVGETAREARRRRRHTQPYR
ncbi:MAG: DUF1707 and DUF2154 domain-containing protein [Deltaproteobacteria bacterium]|nr:DUF1707 and DUF2154 domain-containing protein [Deltaproteobacteria bacterium]